MGKVLVQRGARQRRCDYRLGKPMFDSPSLAYVVLLLSLLCLLYSLNGEV